MFDLDKLQQMSTSKTFPKGTIIVEEGKAAPYSMYIILSGSAAVYKDFRGRSERQLATLKPGSFFGEMSLFLQVPRTATVVTQESTVVLEIDQLSSVEIFSQNPGLAMHIMQVQCARSEENKHVDDI